MISTIIKTILALASLFLAAIAGSELMTNIPITQVLTVAFISLTLALIGTFQ